MRTRSHKFSFCKNSIRVFIFLPKLECHSDENVKKEKYEEKVFLPWELLCRGNHGTDLSDWPD